MGELRDLAELASVHKPMQLIEPSPNSGKLRQRWDDAVSRSREWIPALSALDF
jgi:hypothetical protein